MFPCPLYPLISIDTIISLPEIPLIKLFCQNSNQYGPQWALAQVQYIRHDPTSSQAVRSVSDQLTMASLQRKLSYLMPISVIDPFLQQLAHQVEQPSELGVTQHPFPCPFPPPLSGIKSQIERDYKVNPTPKQLINCINRIYGYKRFHLDYCTPKKYQELLPFFHVHLKQIVENIMNYKT